MSKAELKNAKELKKTEAKINLLEEQIEDAIGNNSCELKKEQEKIQQEPNLYPASDKLGSMQMAEVKYYGVL